MSFSLNIKTAETLAAQQLEALKAQIVAAVKARVEEQARAIGYDSAAICASYAASSVPEWATEAAIFISWRDQIWGTVISLIDAVEANANSGAVEGVLAALPDWPSA